MALFCLSTIGSFWRNFTWYHVSFHSPAKQVPSPAQSMRTDPCLRRIGRGAIACDPAAQATALLDVAQIIRT